MICCCPDAEGSLQTGVGRNILGSLCGITKWFLEIQGRLKTENSARATIGLPPKGEPMVALFCLKGLFCALNVISNVVLPQDAVNIGTGCSQFFLIIFIIGVGVVLSRFQGK